MAETKSVLQQMSEGLSAAAEKGGLYTVLVDGRHGYPSSGIFVDEKHVVSSDHTVLEEDNIRLVTPGGDTVMAGVRGRDAAHDLVLLEFEGPVGTEPPVSDKNPVVGELVLALARPSDDGVQASLGVIGISGGTYAGGPGPALQNVIRTDAAAFPGFAGGPLVDTEGRLVGVNAAGRGSLLTIPAETVVSIAKKMSESGSIKQAYLGVRSQTAEISTTSELSRDQETGLLIVGVEDDSPATQSGIITGDIVVAFNSEPIRTPGALLDSLANSQEGDTAKIEIIRGGKVISVEVELGGRDVRSQRHHRGRRGHRHRR